ncbi:hypothetical protein H0E87_004175 [Populus deltoides]|uniref:Uncharacterized protein n=1 Tax=Populus deltoides TaxID=3696 RepID=A0A8T2ZE61_POPDE|nr:hypothetical protein H0E87_004175 [Populus deltoides]
MSSKFHWGASLRTSAAIKNAVDGVEAILLVITVHLAEDFTNSALALLSAPAFPGYFPPLLVIIICPALVLLASGDSGVFPLEVFLADQIADDDEKQASTKEEKVDAPAVMGASLFLFFCGIYFGPYKYVKPTGSPLTTAYRVFKAATRKRHLDYPRSADGCYMNNEKRELQISLVHPLLRWIDRAAIREPSSSSGGQESTNIGESVEGGSKAHFNTVSFVDDLPGVWSGQAYPQMKLFINPINWFVLAIQRLLIILFVEVGFRNWIQHDIMEDSHLDKIFLLLAILSGGNLCLHALGRMSSHHGSTCISTG